MHASADLRRLIALLARLLLVMSTAPSARRRTASTYHNSPFVALGAASDDAQAAAVALDRDGDGQADMLVPGEAPAVQPLAGARMYALSFPATVPAGVHVRPAHFPPR
jgi:hypothetical protein